MQLRDISMDDLPLYMELLTDPPRMSELGGPPPREDLAEKHRGIVADVQAGTVWYSVIGSDDTVGAPVGTVCIWDHEFLKAGTLDIEYAGRTLHCNRWVLDLNDRATRPSPPSAARPGG